MNLRSLPFFVLTLVLFLRVPAVRAQSSGTVSGVVKDPSGGALASATVEISDPVSGYSRQTSTGPAGDFRFTNIPFNPYHLVITAPGFAQFSQDIAVRSVVPVSLELNLKLSTSTESITVEAGGTDLVETESTPHTDMDRDLFDKLPLESKSSSVSSLVSCRRCC